MSQYQTDVKIKESQVTYLLPPIFSSSYEPKKYLQIIVYKSLIETMQVQVVDTSSS